MGTDEVNEPTLDSVREEIRKTIFFHLFAAEESRRCGYRRESEDSRSKAFDLIAFAGRCGLLTMQEGQDWSHAVEGAVPVRQIAEKYMREVPK